MFSFNSGQLGGFVLNLCCIIIQQKQKFKKTNATSLFKVLFFVFVFSFEFSDCAQRGSDRTEREDVERQTGHKPDLFAGKAVETAAAVKWKV